MPLVVNVGNSILNQSNIGLNGPQQLAMPPGWNEIDGYKEHFLRDDMEVVRYFRGPWNGNAGVSSRALFYTWVLGYSQTTLLQQVELAGGGLIVGPDGSIRLPDAARQAGQIQNVQQTPILSRVPPTQHPEYPWMYATGVELIRGEGAIGLNQKVVLTNNFGNPVPDQNGNQQQIPMIAYFDSGNGSDAQSAVVAVTYRHLMYEIRTDEELFTMQGGKGELERWVERKGEGAVTNLPLPNGRVFYVKNPAAVNAPNVQNGAAIPANLANVILFMDQLEYTWIDVPDVPWDTIKASVGRVNSQPFDGARGWPTYPPGTILCQAPRRERHRTPLGRISWDITYRFLFNPNGFNNALAEDGNFWPVAYANGATPYPQVDLMQLFTVPAPVTYQ